jgi:hypothetical protein
MHEIFAFTQPPAVRYALFFVIINNNADIHNSKNMYLGQFIRIDALPLSGNILMNRAAFLNMSGKYLKYYLQIKPAP